jgi:hypothetical protein
MSNGGSSALCDKPRDAPSLAEHRELHPPLFPDVILGEGFAGVAAKATAWQK